MIPVHPDELHDVWSWVREGLLVVQEKSGDGWIPEDVYMALKQGHSSLHITPEYDGFVVVTPARDYRGMKLHVWCAFHTEQDGVVRYLPDIKEMAKQINAKRITLDSNRKGWEKFFTPTLTSYEMEL